MLPIGRIGLYTLLVALPVAVEVPSDSTGRTAGSMTRITVIGGVGTYSLIDRGCDNQIIRSRTTKFRDAAGSVEHEFANGFVVGLRGGKTEEKRETIDYTPGGYDPWSGGYVSTTQVVSHAEWTNSYVNPHLAFEDRQVGVGAGWIWSRNPFSGSDKPVDAGPSLHMRFGRRDGNYFLISYMENMPLYSGGGYLDLGIGMHALPSLDFMLGLAASPYDGPGVSMKVDYRVLPNWSLLGKARVGGAAGEAQSGVALGISYSTRPPLPVHRSRKSMTSREGDTDGDGWRSRLDPKEPEPPRLETPSATNAAVVAPVVAPVVIPTTDDGKYPDYGSYQTLDSLAVPITRADPVAPDTTTGTVFVATLVARTGQVVETRVIKSIPALDAAAIACVRQWTFRPAIDRGRAVASWVTVPVRFGSE